MKKANCPDCDAEIEVPEDVMKGEIISCPSCGLELEVTEIKADCVELKELGIINERYFIANNSLSEILGLEELMVLQKLWSTPNILKNLCGRYCNKPKNINDSMHHKERDNC